MLSSVYEKLIEMLGTRVVRAVFMILSTLLSSILMPLCSSLAALIFYLIFIFIREPTQVTLFFSRLRTREDQLDDLK